MFCPKCGQLLADGVKVCINCGNIIVSDDDERTIHIERDSKPPVVDDDERTMRFSDVYGHESNEEPVLDEHVSDKNAEAFIAEEEQEGTALLTEVHESGEIKPETFASSDEEGTTLLSEESTGENNNGFSAFNSSASAFGYQVGQGQTTGQQTQHMVNQSNSSNGFQVQQQNYGYTYGAGNAQNGQAIYKGKSVSFGEAIKSFFSNYANFSGRATKSEYWWAFLFNLIVSTVLAFIPYVGAALTIGLMIPGISIGVRRLHDVGKRGTYLFMGLIPFAGAIILIVEFCKDSVGDNQWGPLKK